MKVNIKKATVELPKAPLKALENPNVGKKPIKRIVIKLGQSIATPIHNNNEVKKMPKTHIPSLLKPENGSTK